MEKKKTICIMADFGWAPYAWLREADELPPYVGLNIANAKTGFYDKEFGILKILEKELSTWCIDYGKNCNKKDFDWKRFNDVGLSLSKKVKIIVGNKYNVEYHNSIEDPNHNGDSIIVVE
ncbi:MAG: hypothetical protein ACYDAX_05655 [Desulfobacteria bacterium]